MMTVITNCLGKKILTVPRAINPAFKYNLFQNIKFLLFILNIYPT